MASDHIDGIPKVMISRPTQQRDYEVDGSYPNWPGGQYFRMEVERSGGVYDPLQVETNPGLSAKLCWCSYSDNCDPDEPGDFRRDAGVITIVRLEQELSVTCLITATCAAELTLERATPFAVGDMLMVKNGSVDASSRLSCEGTAVTDLGEYADGRSTPLTIGGDDDELGIFEWGITQGEVGEYLLCWCQGSTRTCTDESDFTFHVGFLTVTAPTYVWPTCAEKEQSFSGWRDWETFDDCCCNYAAAGAVGCLNETSNTYSICAQYPAR
mmetsp:Transcript_62634/g.132335  ORF Transcript_62634/g.132335 Transcript_62634/m.132335 type:complete len:269 (-) Transcript_62634:228-1034(-)